MVRAQSLEDIIKTAKRNVHIGLSPLSVIDVVNHQPPPNLHRLHENELAP
eukprot:CAMPEP_0197526022 /NCGR_PEP_ID=MMETSP1318-20131121/15755_1 /TAXON_ID=552666 /ORGANISM="Partenskyella glossopodia, Strain RCC365" /LENGTH=49 /DNA_ID= /DNA_START= /DNA_END= /DNA_ORIENTATION=